MNTLNKSLKELLTEVLVQYHTEQIEVDDVVEYVEGFINYDYTGEMKKVGWIE